MLSNRNNATPVWRRFLLVPIILLGLASIIATSDSDFDFGGDGDSGGQNADVVIGQANFVDIAANRGGTAGANTLNGPFGNVAVVDAVVDVLYVADTGNNRVLGFNGVPTVPNAVANFVLGQTNSVGTTPGTSASQFFGPQAPADDGGKFIVTDRINNRVLIYNSVPITGPGAADVAVGQINLDASGLGCTSSTLDGPETAIIVNGKLLVTDTRNARVLIWDTIPVASGAPANIVLGQPNFDTCISNKGGSPNASTLSGPAGIWSDGTQLIVNDSLNNRVLIWSSFPTGNDTPANLVLGQSNFANNDPNDDDQTGGTDGAPTARTLNNPTSGVHFNGTQLCVADRFNNRVLIWDSFPTQNFQPANRVLGQPDFVKNLPNDPAPSAATLSFPSGCYFHNNQLIVTDASNNRVLIYSAP